MAVDPQQAQLNQQKAAVLAAMAQGGQAQQAAYQTAQQGLGGAKNEAVGQALTEAAQRGAPQAMQGQIAGTVGSRYDLMGSGLAAGASSRLQDSQYRQAAENDFLTNISQVVPLLRAQTDKRVAEQRSLSEAERASRQQGYDYELQRAKSEAEMRLEAIRLEMERVAQEAARKAAEQAKPSLAEARAQQSSQLFAEADEQRRYRIAAVAQALKALGIDNPDDAGTIQAGLDRGSMLLGRSPYDEDTSTPQPDTPTSAKRRKLTEAYEKYINEDPYQSNLQGAREIGISAGADPAVLSQFVQNESSYGALQSAMAKGSAPNDALSHALIAKQNGVSDDEIAAAMAEDGIDTQTQLSILRIIQDAGG